jgi:hypothetical protein
MIPASSAAAQALRVTTCAHVAATFRIDDLFVNDGHIGLHVEYSTG